MNRIPQYIIAIADAKNNICRSYLFPKDNFVDYALDMQVDNDTYCTATPYFFNSGAIYRRYKMVIWDRDPNNYDEDEETWIHYYDLNKKDSSDNVRNYPTFAFYGNYKFHKEKTEKENWDVARLNLNYNNFIVYIEYNNKPISKEKLNNPLTDWWLNKTKLQWAQKFKEGSSLQVNNWGISDIKHGDIDDNPIDDPDFNPERERERERATRVL